MRKVIDLQPGDVAYISMDALNTGSVNLYAQAYDVMEGDKIVRIKYTDAGDYVIEQDIPRAEYAPVKVVKLIDYPIEFSVYAHASKEGNFDTFVEYLIDEYDYSYTYAREEAEEIAKKGNYDLLYVGYEIEIPVTIHEDGKVEVGEVMVV